MYDHNQRLVPDAFLAIHVKNERLTLTREQLEQRYELSEDLALHIAARLAGVPAEDEALQSKVLKATLSGLLEAPAQVSEPEARWIVHRVIELCGWDGSLGDAETGG
jgi:hypothetical protein